MAVRLKSATGLVARSIVPAVNAPVEFSESVKIASENEPALKVSAADPARTSKRALLRFLRGVLPGTAALGSMTSLSPS
jgi:hypothetical protein